MFNNGSHGVLEQFKQRVIKMWRDVNDLNRDARFQVCQNKNWSKFLCFFLINCWLDFTVVLRDFQIGRGQVILIAKEFGVFVGIAHHWLDVAIGIDAADMSSVVHLSTKQQRCNNQCNHFNQNEVEIVLLYYCVDWWACGCQCGTCRNDQGSNGFDVQSSDRPDAIHAIRWHLWPSLGRHRRVDFEFWPTFRRI